ncbi:MAG TPA: cyclic nucleotide-binding domain-containing protein [Bauldia sp.]|nr:cyclic nucleotide-binding domain-containing protein [Bauldia sp.]
MTAAAEVNPHDRAVALAVLRDAAAASPEGDRLSLPHWSEADWGELLDVADFRRIPAGEAIIRRGTADKALFIVLDGEVEVIAHASDGLSFGRLARFGPGSVVGEQSFFDGGPRSAGAWAVRDCAVATLTPEQFAAFADTNPGLGRDFLLALGRILSLRLRRTTAKTL